jgi:hypothetical protein
LALFVEFFDHHIFVHIRGEFGERHRPDRFPCRGGLARSRRVHNDAQRGRFDRHTGLGVRRGDFELPRFPDIELFVVVLAHALRPFKVVGDRETAVKVVGERDTAESVVGERVTAVRVVGLALKITRGITCPAVAIVCTSAAVETNLNVELLTVNVMPFPRASARPALPVEVPMTRPAKLDHHVTLTVPRPGLGRRVGRTTVRDADPASDEGALRLAQLRAHLR